MLHKILKLGSYRITFVLLVIISFSFSFLSLYLKGKGLEEVVIKSTTPLSIILIIFGFAFCNLIASFIRTIIIFWRQWLQKEVYKKSWTHYSANNLNEASSKKFEHYFQTITNYLPNIQDIKAQMTIFLSSTIIIYSMYIVKMIQDRLWIAAIFIPILGIFSFLSAKIGSESQKEKTNAFYKEQNKILKFCKEYFNGYRERQLNNSMIDLHDQVGRSFLNKWSDYNSQQFKRSLLSFSFIDAPFVISMSIVFIAAAYNKIGFSDLVIWIGLIEFIVQANKNLSQWQQSKIQLKSLRNMTQNIEDYAPKSINGKAALSDSELKVVLNDGTYVSISSKPGIYQINGSNGSGKSTLMNVVANLQNEYNHWPKDEINHFKASISNQVYLIERNPVCYSYLNSLADQISGVYNTNIDSIIETINSKFYEFSEVIQCWTEEILNLDQIIRSRNSNDVSAGEGVILSLARFLYHCNSNPKALIIDEVDSVLDKNKQQLFKRLIKILSNKIAIYYISHVSTNDSYKKEAVCSSFSLGYARSSNVGRPFELRLSCHYKGNLTIQSSGDLANSLKSELPLVIESLALCDSRLNYLKKCDYFLEAFLDGFKIKEIRSARLALAAALLNIDRVFYGKMPINGVAATGYVRLDGSVDPVSYLNEKIHAANSEDYITRIFTPSNTNHLSHIIREFAKA